MGRLLRSAVLTACAVALATVFTLVATVTLGGDPVRTDASVRGDAPARAAAAGTDVASLQDRLKVYPRDHRAWSRLALAYVELARVTADPTYYAKAEHALGRGMRLAPGDSVVLTATATLAAARHDFSAALAAADRALDANPYSATAHAVRSDALTELGRYAEARRAAMQADDLEPGPATFTRLSYAAELRGEPREATRLMRLARNTSGTSAATYAFASYNLGELARIGGDLRGAARHYAAALDAVPAYPAALAGRARLHVARGETAAAVRDYRAVVARLPLPEYVVELGELYLATRRPRLAQDQLDVAAASAALARANGVRTDLETALYEADHGSPVEALRAARAEWTARQSIHTADALGWALHASGRHSEALRYARLATRLDTRDARLLFHRGAIEAALGLDAAARTHLRAALDLDQGVAPLRERQARELLRGLR